MFILDGSRLTPLEKEAWEGFSRRAGDENARAMVEIMSQWVARLLQDGKTPAEATDKVIGTFYDNVSLMYCSQATRNQTIALAKAMVRQIIDGVLREPQMPVDSAHLVKLDGQ